MNSKQITLYDLVVAANQIVRQGNDGQGNIGHGNAGRKRQGVGYGNVGQGSGGQNYAGKKGANLVDGGQPPRHPAYPQAQSRYDDGETAMEKASYHKNPLSHRVGQIHMPADVALHRLDRIYMSKILESEAPPGLACFGPRIMKEEAMCNFQLPRDKKTYDGSTKLEDWLIDYDTAVYVARGNRRWAMRYVL
jgi:hypothetical protein